MSGHPESEGNTISESPFSNAKASHVPGPMSNDDFNLFLREAEQALTADQLFPSPDKVHQAATIDPSLLSQLNRTVPILVPVHPQPSAGQLEDQSTSQLIGDGSGRKRKRARTRRKDTEVSINQGTFPNQSNNLPVTLSPHPWLHTLPVVGGESQPVAGPSQISSGLYTNSQARPLWPSIDSERPVVNGGPSNPVLGGSSPLTIISDGETDADAEGEDALIYGMFEQGHSVRGE